MGRIYQNILARNDDTFQPFRNSGSSDSFQSGNSLVALWVQRVFGLLKEIMESDLLDFIDGDSRGYPRNCRRRESSNDFGWKAEHLENSRFNIDATDAAFKGLMIFDRQRPVPRAEPFPAV